MVELFLTATGGCQTDINHTCRHEPSASISMPDSAPAWRLAGDGAIGDPVDVLNTSLWVCERPAAVRTYRSEGDGVTGRNGVTVSASGALAGCGVCQP